MAAWFRRIERIRRITSRNANAHEAVTIEWEDEEGNSGTTFGRTDNPHLQELIHRAERESLPCDMCAYKSVGIKDDACEKYTGIPCAGYERVLTRSQQAP